MVELLRRLSSENGVSGNEDNVRNLIIREIGPLADKISVDSIGNIIAFKQGKRSNKKLMLTAHMDEPGFIVSGITEKGYIKFKSVGRIDSRTIISKCVVIGEKKINGIIGMKAIHLQKREERENTVNVSDLFIDIGAKSKKAAERVVKLGDYITFNTKFGAVGNNVKGKALDSRIGCCCLIELLKKDYEDDIYAVFTSQYEIENRGARIAAYNINPDYAIVLDTVEAADMYNSKEKNAALGGGAVISFMDKRTIADKALSNKLIDVAKAENIPFQLNKAIVSASDGGSVQAAGNGAKVVNISVPCRYSHTPVSIVSRADMQSVVELTYLFLRNGDNI